MVNASFVFGMDEDGPDVFDRTVSWAIEQGIETATFHILTPYPDTALFQRIEAEGRLLHREWGLYDTRHVVFAPTRLAPAELESGYWRAYRDFYRWGSILRGAGTKAGFRDRCRHVAYAAGWKKFEPLWDAAIRTGQVLHALPLLELVLTSFGRHGCPRAASGNTAPHRGFRRAVDGPPQRSNATQKPWSDDPTSGQSASVETLAGHGLRSQSVRGLRADRR
jgi:hypothetical protein